MTKKIEIRLYGFHCDDNTATTRYTYIYTIYPRELPYSTQVDYLLSQYASKFMKFILLENQLVIMKSKAKV